MEPRFVSELLASPYYPWMRIAMGAVVALAVVVVAFRIGIRVARRLVQHRPVARTVVKAAEEPGRLVVALIALQAVWNSAPDSLYAIGTVERITTLALIGAVTWLAVRAASGIGQVMALLYPWDSKDNLRARRIQTQARVITRTLSTLIVVFGLACALMTFPSVRQIGAGLLASAGVAGLVAGLAAKPVLGNLLAGLQIAFTQPIRLDDVVIIRGEYGTIEEITGSYVVVKVWDERRLVVPLQWFIENIFENWTRVTSQILGTVMLWVDYGMPLEGLRAEMQRVCETSPLWDKRVAGLQVVDSDERAMQIRILVSSFSSGDNFDLRCLVREQLIAYIRREHPDYLPRLRSDTLLEEKETPGTEHPPRLGLGRGRSGDAQPQERRSAAALRSDTKRA